MFFWNSLAFLMIQRMLSIWSLVPFPFLNPAWTSGSSWFMYCWSLAWRILSITFLARWMQLCGSLSILWHCLSLGLEWKLTFSCPVANAEFSKFAGLSFFFFYQTLPKDQRVIVYWAPTMFYKLNQYFPQFFCINLPREAALLRFTGEDPEL